MMQLYITDGRPMDATAAAVHSLSTIVNAAARTMLHQATTTTTMKQAQQRDGHSNSSSRS